MCCHPQASVALTSCAAPIRSQVIVERLTYTGGPDFYENGTMYIPHPAADVFAGEPSPEIDANWERLTKGKQCPTTSQPHCSKVRLGRYFLIPESEAQETFGADYRSFYNEDVQGYEIGCVSDLYIVPFV